MSLNRAELFQQLLQQRGVNVPRREAIPRRPAGGPPALSFAQERLFLLDQLAPGSAAYNIPVAWRLTGVLDVAALRRSLGAVVQRHEVLRTAFDTVQGVPVQRVSPPGRVPLPLADLSGFPEEERERRAEREVRDEAARPFDLRRGPLLRARLLRLSAREHTLLLTVHHAAGDGWSVGVLFRELEAFYAGFARGEPARLPELPIQYADYATWQRSHLAGDALERQVAFWVGQLQGAPALLELPADRPRPAVQRHRGTKYRQPLPDARVSDLQALSRREGATLFMTLLAAFQLLLSRWSGQDDVVVGSPIADRDRAEVEPLIGMFTNTLALRTHHTGDPDFLDRLDSVRDATLRAYANADLPFERLVEALRVERSLAYHPVFQAMFSLQTATVRPLALEGLTATAVRADNGTTKFDLTLAIEEREGWLEEVWEFDVDLFDAATVECMAAQFHTLLEGIAADPALPVSRLPLLADRERERVLAKWNDTATDHPADACIHHLFEARAARTPGAVALVFEGERITYAELDARSNQLARFLHRRGVGPEERVGVALERSPEMVVALLGILKAGAAYVPLDPEYPAERLAYMLGDSGVPVLLTQARFRAGLPLHVAEPVCLDEGWPEVARESAEPARTGVDAGNLAYVIYTSGSTGRPKGVMNAHRGVVNRLLWMQESYGLGAGDRVLQKTPFSFDVSVWEFFWPLLAGGTLVLARPGGHREPAYLVEVIEAEEIRVAHFVPAMLQHFLDEPGVERCASLHRVVCSGEALPPALQERFFARLPGVELLNLYGPTEAAVEVTSWRCLPGEGRSTVPIGRPVANTRTYVLDAHREPVPAGVPGELYLGGVQVARGYLGRPALTAERFVPDPFGEPGARLYRTGDRARWRPDGVLEFLGRLDFQVKVRGFRVEPGEIESALLGVPGVRECVVLVREDTPGDPRLVAYLGVGEGEGSAPATEQLRARLKVSLPEYMVPSAFVVLEALPRTPNGKTDRGALPAPAGHAEGGAELVAPRTPVEEVLAGIWAEVLKLDAVGVDEDFFALGGHSLLAARVAARVHDVLHVELSLRALFEAHTVAGLACLVEAELRGGHAAQPLPVLRVPRDGLLPLTFAQQRLWFLERMGGIAGVYTIPGALRLRGALDVGALERALAEVVRRHESLRTAFVEHEGTPAQVVRPATPTALPVRNLAAGEPEQREAELQRRIRDASTQAFDLEAGPLFRAELLRLGAEEHVLLWTMHHIVGDGWSTEVLRRELSALYAAFMQGEPSPFPEPEVQYGDYAVWQRGQMDDQMLDAHLAYWKERLAGAPSRLELPTDRPRPAVRGHRGTAYRFVLPAALAAALKAVARAEGATPYMTLLAAYQLLLAKYSGQEDVVVGSSAAGRSRPELEDLIGFFVNTLVLRTHLTGDPTFRDLLARVRETAVGAYAHQDLPFERLVEALQPERSLSHAPLFQVFFVLHAKSVQPAEFGPVAAEPIPAGFETAMFDLTLSISEAAGGLTAAIGYSTELWEADTIRRMAGHLETLLEAIAEDPRRRLSEFQLLGAAEREQVLRVWNPGAWQHPAEGTLHGRFAAQAQRFAERVAATDEAGSLTYARLDARSSQLARYLRGRGVGPEVRVGLCLDRGLEMVVAILGVLKAGAAYVPLDPAYPAERLGYILGDSGVEVVVTHSALLGQLPQHAAEVVLVDGHRNEIAREAEENPGVEVDPGALAYMIYTSGSTGSPKGAMLTHASVLSLFRATDVWFGFDECDVWTLFHSFAFDFSVWELWGALLYGGRVVVVPFLTSRSPEQFRALLKREGVTVLNQTPSAFQQLVHVEEREPEPLERLRLVVFGGEALKPESLRPWLDRYGPEWPRLVNMYGITETCVHVTYRPVRGGDLRGVAVGSPIGRAIADLRLYVLDAAMNPVPVGVPGELYVGGEGLARGYWRRPALTAERFVPDPYPLTLGARLYRTGDRARWKADGDLEYLGRLDHQVKVRGFRVEPGEIEAALLAQPGVTAAVVVVRGEGADAALVAYLATPGEAPPPSALRDALRRRLPDYMVPAAFVALDRIPLTANGKTDLGALPAPDVGGAGAAREFVAPATEVEEALSAIWCEVLGMKRVGAHDDFFELGGHSLRATQVMARIEALFETPVPLRVLFEGPTVAELAARVEELRGGERPQRLPVALAGRNGPLPLSFAQERLWFLQRMQPGSTSYNHPIALRLRGPLDRAALERALGEIVRRHEVLRTAFHEVDGAPVQVIAPFLGFALPADELSGMGDAEREAEVRLRAAADADGPFDLAAGPLFRARLLRLGEEENVLLLCMHHVVTDGWSTGVLFRELSALYGAYREGRESPLAEPAMQYADFAVWQREQLRGEALEGQLAYWRERLAGAPALLELPLDRPRPLVQSSRGAQERLELPAELLERLRELGRREGATLYMTLLGAFQVLLGRYAGSEDVVVGSPIAGRTRAETEELIGFFVNTLVLRVDLSGEPTFRDVLRRVRAVTLGAYEHQELPFERLVEELQPERSLGHSPLFQVMFALGDAAAVPGALPGLAVEPLESEAATTKFDLNLVLTETSGGLRATLGYGTDLFERGTALRMLGHLERVLAQVAADAELRVADLDLLDGEERRHVLTGWNDTARVFADEPAHVLFAAQARRTPEAVAILHEGNALTYGELDRRAEALAGRLRGLGVGPEIPVGLCVERTPDLLVGVLGTWKAGGAYVPLDPGYPAERLGWIVDDAAIPVVLTAGRAGAALPEGLRATVLGIDPAGEEGAPLAPAGELRQAAAHASSLAYVIYTSGSTGRPKGVLVQHGSLANLLCATREAFGVRAGDVMPALASHAFDIWLFEAVMPLVSGAAVRLVDRERVLDVPSLLEEASDATLLHAVPALMRQVAQVERDTPRLGRLRRVFVGGDLVPPELLAEMGAVLSAAETHVLYGPTEGTILASAHAVPARGAPTGHPIGTPLENVRLYVCDGRGSPLPVGVPGELLVGGAGVARGYRGRPELTAERFVPDPFWGDGAGGRLYRTGDRVRRRADGTLEYLGRMDQQVKIRGFRIEPGEIEAALRRHPEVADCVVVARDDTSAPGERRLVAYVVGQAEADGLREHLRLTLPEHMVPGSFVAVGSIPLTPNGKLDRAALPAPECGAGAVSLAPRDEMEQRVAEVWRSVLGISAIGVDDNFFDLGGTSLLLYRVFSRLRTVRSSLRVVDLFRYATVEALARHLGAEESQGDASGLAESHSRAAERRASRQRVRGG
jgi:amino acid adenylation domain-containing protein